MTLDHVLNAALQARGTKAVLLLNEFHVPIAGRGDLPEAELQAISQLLGWTEVDSTGRIPLNDGRWLHFHHAQSHTLALIINGPTLDSPAPTERATDLISPVSTSVETLREQAKLPIAMG